MRCDINIRHNGGTYALCFVTFLTPCLVALEMMKPNCLPEVIYLMVVTPETLNLLYIERNLVVFKCKKFNYASDFARCKNRF